MSSARDWLFDPTTGSLLKVDGRQGVYSDDTNFKQNLEELSEMKILHTTALESFHVRFKLEPLVPRHKAEEEEEGTQRATVNERCPKCNHNGLLFFTLQIRSADEGQTVFYECPECGYKYSQNN